VSSAPFPICAGIFSRSRRERSLSGAAAVPTSAIQRVPRGSAGVGSVGAWIGDPHSPAREDGSWIENYLPDHGALDSSSTPTVTLRWHREHVTRAESCRRPLQLYLEQLLHKVSGHPVTHRPAPVQGNSWEQSFTFPVKDSSFSLAASATARHNVLTILAE